MRNASAKQIIALLNRRKAMSKLESLYTKPNPALLELSYLLDRITAHKMDIRSIEPKGD